MVNKANSQALAAVFFFGIVFCVAIATTVLYSLGGVSSLLHNGPRLVLVVFLTSSFLWAFVSFVGTLVDSTNTVGCQVAVTFSSLFDQLARVFLEEFLFFAMKPDFSLSVGTILPQVLIVVRFILGGIFVGVRGSQFKPVCVGKTRVLGLAIAVLLSDVVVILLLVVRASTLGVLRRLAEKTATGARSKALIFVLAGLALWTTLSIPMTLGISSFDITVRTVLPALGLLAAIALLAIFSRSLATAQEGKKNPTTPTARGPVEFLPPKPTSSRGLQNAAAQPPPNQLAGARTGPTASNASTHSATPSAGSKTDLPANTGQLRPPTRAHMVAPPLRAAPKAPKKSPLKKGGKLVISGPIATPDCVEGPLTRIATMDLATAVDADRERRKTVLQGLKSNSDDAKSAEPPSGSRSIASDMNDSSSTRTVGSVQPAVQRPDTASTTSAQPSPGSVDSRRRSPRKARHADSYSPPVPRKDTKEESGFAPFTRPAPTSNIQERRRTRALQMRTASKAPALPRAPTESQAPVLPRAPTESEVPALPRAPAESQAPALPRAPAESQAPPMPRLASDENSPPHSKNANANGTSMQGYPSRAPLMNLSHNGPVRSDIRPSRQTPSVTVREIRSHPANMSMQPRQPNGIPRHPGPRPMRPPFHPNAMRMHPNAMRPHPNAMRPHPNAMRPHPNAMRPHPNAMRPHPNALRAHPHALRAHPHALRAHPDALRVHPDAMRVHPDAMRNNPSALPRSAGVLPPRERRGSETRGFPAQIPSSTADGNSHGLKRRSASFSDIPPPPYVAAPAPPAPVEPPSPKLSQSNVTAVELLPETPVSRTYDAPASATTRSPHSPSGFSPKVRANSVTSAPGDRGSKVAASPAPRTVSNHSTRRRSSLVLPNTSTPKDDKTFSIQLGMARSPAASPQVPTTPKAASVTARSPWKQKPSARTSSASSILVNDSGEDGREIMTIMLDQSSPRSVGSPLQWHRRPGQECPTFSNRKTLMLNRKLVLPAPLILGKPNKTRKIVPESPLSLESPTAALARIHSQLDTFEESDEEKTATSQRFLTNVEAEMNVQEDHWQKMRSDYSRASTSPATSSPADTQRGESLPTSPTAKAGSSGRVSPPELESAGSGESAFFDAHTVLTDAADRESAGSGKSSPASEDSVESPLLGSDASSNLSTPSPKTKDTVVDMGSSTVARSSQEMSEKPRTISGVLQTPTSMPAPLPVSHQPAPARPVTQRPPRQSRRISNLPDILENPEPMKDRRATLGIFQFPWGEKSDTGTVEAPTRTLASHDQSFFDSEDSDDKEDDEDEEHAEEDDKVQSRKNTGFDESTLWDIAHLLRSDEVPSRDSLFPRERMNQAATSSTIESRNFSKPLSVAFGEPSPVPSGTMLRRKSSIPMVPSASPRLLVNEKESSRTNDWVSMSSVQPISTPPPSLASRSDSPSSDSSSMQSNVTAQSTVNSPSTNSDTGSPDSPMRSKTQGKRDLVKAKDMGRRAEEYVQVQDSEDSGSENFF
ncbi:hypothetical protein RJ55_00810 [Drechmeria coniospora]|nr:hypothetical protein RJ55_00810 [Drechmeria coniospora]